MGFSGEHVLLQGPDKAPVGTAAASTGYLQGPPCIAPVSGRQSESKPGKKSRQNAMFPVLGAAATQLNAWKHHRDVRAAEHPRIRLHAGTARQATPQA